MVPIKYQGIRIFSEGLADVKLNDKCGFMHPTGKEVISPQDDFRPSAW